VKTLGKILGGLVVLAVAVIVAGIAVLKSMDFDTYRGMIADQVKAATGRELVIAGPLKVEVSLNPALAVEGVTFANAPWGSRKDMIVLKRLAAEVQLLPLLRGEVRVNRMVLSGLDALFEIDGQGRANWDIAPAGPPAARRGGDSRPLPVFDKVDIRDVRISYRDARDGTAMNLTVEAFALESKDAKSPIAVTLKAAHDGRAVSVTGRIGALKSLMEANARYPVRLEIEIAGVKAAVDGHVVNPRAPKEFDFKATLAGDSVSALLPPGQNLPPVGPLKAAFRIKGQGRTYAIENLEAGIGQSYFAGSARIALAPPVADVTATLHSRRVDLKQWLPPDAKAEKPSAKGGRVFPDDPLPLDALRIVNADVKHRVETAVLPNGLTVREVDAHLTLKDGRLALPIALVAAGGRIRADASIDGARVPARNGIAIETGKMTVAGSGHADLGAETLNFAFKPEAREGFGIGLGNLVGRMRIEGTFAEPTYGLDPLAAVTGTVGAVTGAVTGVVSGGLSTITGVLTGERAKTDASPCQVALGLAPARSPSAPAPTPTAEPKPAEEKKQGIGDAVRGLGEGIGRGLKGILGR